MDLDIEHPDGPMGFTRVTPSKPTIAAIGGWCLAGGFEIALWCDLRIATEDSTFGLFERRWGVPLIDGGTQRLPRIVGMGRALELTLTGRPVEAEEALRIGLVNEVVPPGRHVERALELAERLAGFPAGDDARRPARDDRGRGPAAGARASSSSTARAARCWTSPPAAPRASPAARAAAARVSRDCRLRVLQRQELHRDLAHDLAGSPASSPAPTRRAASSS